MRQRSSFLTWIVFGVLAASYTLIGFLSQESRIGAALLGMAYLSMALVALIYAARAMRATVGLERRTWSFLSITLGLVFVGELVWITREVLVGAAAAYEPGVAHVFYLASFVPLSLYTLMVLGAGLSGAPLLTRVRYILDLAIAAVMVVAGLVLTFLLPTYGRTSPTDVPAWMMAAVLLLIITCVFVALFAALLESRQSVWTRGETKIVAGVGMVMASGIVTIAFELYSASAIGSRASIISDLLWIGGYALFAAAAAQRIRGVSSALSMPATAHARRSALRWYDLSTAAILLFAVPYTLYEARYGQLGEAQFWILAGASFSVAIMVIIRSIILTSENGSLLFHTVVDPLTGAFNHRYFQERVNIEMERARRATEPLSLMFMDIDGFGIVNEHHGHSRGDRCLVRVVELVRMHERAADTLCRMGGDEFAMIMADTDSRAAAARARLIQTAMAADPQIKPYIDSVSIGIACYPEHASERTALIAKADGALYWAQATGTGKIVVYDEKVVEALDPRQRLLMAEEQSYMQTVESLASAVDARDPYTQFHSRNVSQLAGKLARQVGLAPNHARLVEIAGLLHDVGKIGVPDSILRKAGALTAEERRKIEEHPDLGQRILSATIFKEILPWVLSHHECWDGSGYPQGLRAEEIPIEARILAVCDSFDAMVSDRPYRKGIPLEVAIREIEVSSGSQFDPQLAESFIELIAADEALLVTTPVLDGALGLATEFS